MSVKAPAIAALVVALWSGAASACLPPLPNVNTVITRYDGEADVEYQERVRRIHAERAAEERAAYATWALNRENSLFSSASVTRVAVVDVVDIAALDDPSSMAIDFLFSVARPERGMERGERFTLTEPRFPMTPCVPVAHYPVGGRYALFASDGPISRQSMIFLLLPAAEVQSERGLALLRAAEHSAH